MHRRPTRDYKLTTRQPAAQGYPSTATWSSKRRLVADEQGRAELEELLLKRAGELWAHLGRYDMYALAIEVLLRGSSPRPAANLPVSIRNRGAMIETQLHKRSLSASVISQFQSINHDLLEIVGRHELAAKNCAVVPVFARQKKRSLPANPREWYEYDAASDEELLFFIDALERDVLGVAGLYVRLSDWAAFLTTGDERGPFGH